MTIYRTKKERDFVIIDNAIVRDPNLSLKAKGLLIYALSRPPDWKFSVAGLSKSCRDGQDSVRSALQELEKAGYIVRERKREKGKYTEVVYNIYEKPIKVFPKQEKPKKETPDKEKPPLPNTDIPSMDIPNIDVTYYPSTDPEKTERWIRENIEYEIMCQRYDRRQLDDLVSVMTEAMLCSADTISVSRDKTYPAAYVRGCIGRIGPLHVEQLLDSLAENRPEIRNVRGYLLTSLINAANTLEIDSKYGEGSRF